MQITGPASRSWPPLLCAAAAAAPPAQLLLWAALAPAAAWQRAALLRCRRPTCQASEDEREPGQRRRRPTLQFPAEPRPCRPGSGDAGMRGRRLPTQQRPSGLVFGTLAGICPLAQRLHQNERIQK